MCSFSGPSSLILIDLLTKFCSKIKVVFINTGLHFPETLKTVEMIKKRYNIDILEIKPEISTNLDFKNHWKNDPDKCSHIRKVIPLEKILSDQEAWITGLRRDQSPTRKYLQPIETDRRGLKKYNPLYNWSFDEVWAYIKQNDILYNPLHDYNYPSIGCQPCTKAIKDGEDIRSGRWSHRKNKKFECGLHL